MAVFGLSRLRCYEDFKLSDLCDGVVFLAPLEALRGVAVDEQFVTAANLEASRADINDLEERAAMKTPADFVQAMREAADVEAAMGRVK
jgi:hypothetical protein